MKYISHYLPVLLLTAITLCLFTDLSAQPMLPSDPEQTPIDGGLGLLAAAGGVYAYKKLKNRSAE
ncbi:MAG TPA: hypothetical protein DEQ34_12075 [Balneolaceae bacterium]|nr:hypothetical protein [Balneolaceae bacterium]